VNEWDGIYDAEDADEVVVIRMTRRQWWHLTDWRAEHPDRYPNRAAERLAAWKAVDEAKSEKEIVAEIADWLMHIDRLDEIPGARIPLPHYNPLWDAAIAIRKKYGVPLRGGPQAS
jgi:hypothetical protein